MSRSRLSGVVAGLVLVTVAAIGQRLSEPSDVTIVTGVPGQPAAYADGSVVVDDVRVGTVVLTSTDDRITTPGIFVVVRVAAQASGREVLPLNHLQLLAEGATYLPDEDESLRAAPGFEESRDVRFEVDPQHIDGLTLEAWGTQGFVKAHGEHVRVPLGITPANADAWRRAGEGSQVDYVISTSERALG